MRLSPLAQDLLHCGEIALLLGMSFDAIIHPSDIELFNTGISNPTTHIRPLDTVIEILVCPILTESLCEPVVVSSGHIYSRKVIEHILQETNTGHHKCPNTREKLKKIPSTNSYFLRLPVIDAALQRFRDARDAEKANIAKATTAESLGIMQALIPPSQNPKGQAIAAPDIVDTLVVGPQIPLNMSPLARELNIQQVATARSEPLSVEPPNAIIKIFVSSNKLRMTINPYHQAPFSEAFQTNLKAALSELFNHQRATQIPQGAHSYFLANQTLGRCWMVSSVSCKLEMWFPWSKKTEVPFGSALYRLTDEEVSGFLSAIVNSLALGVIEGPMDAGPALEMDSLTDRQQREYFPLFNSQTLGYPLTMTAVIDCCRAFMRHSDVFLRNRSPEASFVDNVIISNIPAATGRIERNVVFSFTPVSVTQRTDNLAAQHARTTSMPFNSSGALSFGPTSTISQSFSSRHLNG